MEIRYTVKKDFLKHKTVKKNNEIQHFHYQEKISIRSCKSQHLKQFWHKELT